MDSLPSRRRFLQVGTGVGAAAVAGCSQLELTDDDVEDDDSSEDDAETVDDIDDDGEADDEETSEPDIEPEDGITALVQPDPEAQQELAMLEQELLQQIEAEEITQEEAIEELEEVQAEMMADAIEPFESYVTDTDDISIEGYDRLSGIFLLDGTNDAFIDALQAGEVSALLPGSEFQIAEDEPQQP